MRQLPGSETKNSRYVTKGKRKNREECQTEHHRGGCYDRRFSYPVVRRKSSWHVLRVMELELRLPRAEAKKFHSGALSDRRLSGQFVAIKPQNCRCVCQGWAEILIRRPSRNISWIMRIQNRATSWLESDVSTTLTDDPQIDECKFDTHLPLRALFFLFHVQ